ncbi:hypothetical protein MNBD_PLANCTO02-1925 [hydrothermal vent metagenome]|uniref:Response regulator n=1 Tax=hydrothermal vent metagenome TaxID=652676 RepID=A0A3B1DD72_9ZZZZ
MEELNPNKKLSIVDSEKTFVGFLASLCHEIRTPVSVIQGYSELLKEQMQNLEDRNVAEIIHQNGQQLLTLLTKLSDLADIETGAMVPYVSTCSPDKILHETATFVQSLAAANDVHISATSDPDLPECVQVDKKRLIQILQQVFEQSIRLASLGEVACQVTSTSPGDKQRMLIYNISIPQSVDDYIFIDQQSGFLPSAADSVSMILARKLVERMGGEFQYLSDQLDCIGIRFSVPVEVVQGEKSQVESDSSPQQDSKKSLKQKKDILKHCRILIVEDHLDNQKLLSYICQRAGATTNCVFNGMIAIGELLAANLMQDPYDIILMDIDMPVMDGYETTRRIRETMDVPIIAITAHTMQGDRERCLEIGCNDYLSKPVDRKLLIETITRLFKQKTANCSLKEATTTTASC